MCLIAVAWRMHPRWRLAVIANRDEFHGRPAADAGADPEHADIFGGRDLTQGGSCGIQGVDDRRVADDGGAEVLDAICHRLQHAGEQGPVDLGCVAQLAAGAAERRPPEGAAGSTDCGDERLAAQHEGRAGQEGLPLPGQRLDHGVEAAGHVGAVITVADGRVELCQVLALRLHGGVDL